MIYLVAMQYHRNDLAFERGNFRVMGDTIDLFPASGEWAFRFEFGFDTLESVRIIDPLTAETREKPDRIHIFPNTHYATPKDQLERALTTIQAEFDERLKYFERHDKFLEAQRLSQRTKYDIEMLKETGFVKGIENYSRHLDGRKACSAGKIDLEVDISVGHAFDVVAPAFQPSPCGDAREDAPCSFGFAYYCEVED